LIALPSALAQLQPVDPNAKAGYFVTNFTQSGQYVVAINAVQNGDIYWHMSAPTVRSWVGVGIGDHMAGALMIVSYKSANGTGVTSAARLGTGHSEPEPAKNVTVEKIWTDAYAPNCNTAKHGAGGIMISHGVCRGCGNLSMLDYGSKAQPFIFAVGPERALNEDALDAPLKRHTYYGRFTMDMTLATSPLGAAEGATYGRVPAPNVGGDSVEQSDDAFVSQGTSLPFDAHVDSDSRPIVHGVLMCLALIVVFPLGALLLRLADSVRWHSAVQSFGLLCVVVGLGTGISVSSEYNRSKNLRSPHQITGLLVFAGVLVQSGLGLTHHLIFKRTKQPTLFRKGHLILGPTIILLALINGGLGIDLALDHSARLPCGIVVAFLFLGFIAARTYLHFYRTAARYKPDEETLEQYRRTHSFGVGSLRSPRDKLGYEGVDVPVPEAYHEGQTPASAGSAGRHFVWDTTSSPVTVAPPTPGWQTVGRLGRSGSGVSLASRDTRHSERDAMVGKGKDFR
ncbi:hypothetical protein LTR53_010355, partial [Teratosphaeriaceae sp. CCFEE 6253]